MGTKNSDLVANFEAAPQVANDAGLLHGVVRVAQGTIALAAGDSDNDDVVMLAPIPSNASITQLFVTADALGGSCTFNIGLYQTNGDVVDEDLYALPEDKVKNIPTVCGSLREAMESLDRDRGFLKQGGVFTDDQIDAFIALKFEEIYNLEHTPHPMEFEMYYSS